jgi:hypothetical protein
MGGGMGPAAEQVIAQGAIFALIGIGQPLESEVIRSGSHDRAHSGMFPHSKSQLLQQPRNFTASCAVGLVSAPLRQLSG